MNKWICEKLNSRLSQLKGLSVLDLGCGEGLNSVGLAKLGAKVTAIDRQAAMIELARESARKEGVEISAEVSKIQDFQSDTQYDIVLFTFVLHFLPREAQTQIMKKAINLVKSGGALVFADLEDSFPVSSECLLLAEELLEDIEVERFTIKDSPHRGANYPHQHKVFYLVGIRK